MNLKIKFAYLIYGLVPESQYGIMGRAGNISNIINFDFFEVIDFKKTLISAPFG